MNTEHHDDQHRARAEGSDTDSDRDSDIGFGSLSHPRALVGARNAVILGEALYELLLDNESTGSNNFALGRAWHSSDTPSPELLRLQREYADHGIDVTTLLLNLARETNLSSEASAALKLVVTLDHKERIINEFVLPALLPEFPGKKTRGNFAFACELGRQFSDREIELLVQSIDLDQLSRRPHMLPTLAIGLNHIRGLEVIHSLTSRVRNFENESQDVVSGVATTAVRIISILLEVEAQRSTNELKVSPHIAADLRDLYVAFDESVDTSALAKFLTGADPAAAETFFAGLLDESANYYASSSSRTKLALHYSQAACRCDDGPTRVSMRIRDEEDPVAIGYLSAPLTVESNPEGHLALAELIIREIQEERTPVILGTVAALAPIFDVSDIFEHVLSVAYQPGKIQKAFSSLSECEIPQPIWANNSLAFAEDAAVDQKLPFKVIDTIGSAAIASWCTEEGGSLTTNALELLECGRNMDEAWWLSSFAQVLALKGHKNLRTTIRTRAGLGKKTDDPGEIAPSNEFGANLD